jgi:hypothetical protein
MILILKHTNVRKSELNLTSERILIGVAGLRDVILQSNILRSRDTLQRTNKRKISISTFFLLCIIVLSDKELTELKYVPPVHEFEDAWRRDSLKSKTALERQGHPLPMSYLLH